MFPKILKFKSVRRAVAYDALGRPAAVTVADGRTLRTVRTAYDDFGRAVKITETAESDTTETTLTENTFDRLGHLTRTRTVFPDGGVLERAYAYDRFGRIQEINSAGRVLRYAYSVNSFIPHLWKLLAVFAIVAVAAMPLAAAADFSPRKAELARAKYEKVSDGGKRYLTVKTDAPHNREVKFFYHVPANYDPAAKHKYRVLIYFGGRNCSGEAEAGDKLDFGAWGDENDVFIVGPGFRDDNYWQPEKWSGKALTDALNRLKTMYNIKNGRLLFYGYSAGSQCANLFAEHFAAQTVAYVAHGCGVFHTPSPKMRRVPGVVTCGDADVARYVISRRFVRACREKGINVIFKSMPNHPHDVPPDSIRLAKEFLLYHHRRTAAELRRDDALIEEEKTSLIGDDVDGVYYPAGDPRVRFIEPGDRVLFSSRTVADAWGHPAPDTAALQAERN